MSATYLSVIATELGLHSKSLYAAKRQRVARGADWPEPVLVLPDGRELYDAKAFVKWYTENMEPHHSSKGHAS